MINSDATCRSMDRNLGANEVVQKVFSRLALGVGGGQRRIFETVGRTDQMARCKTIDTGPRFLAVDLARQLSPGTFERALTHLLDRELGLSRLDALSQRYDRRSPSVCGPA